MPSLDKEEAIKNIEVRKSQEVIVLINYYRDIWQNRSKILNHLSSMTSKQAKWN